MALSLMAVGYTYAQEVPTTVTETTELLPAPAQEAPKPEPKIEVKPAGRILIDAGYFNANEQKDKFVSGVAIPDARAGLGVRYGNWKAKVDIGYAYGKLSPKDIFIEYGFSKHTLLRGGYFVHQFGMQSATSSSFKISMEEPQSNEAFFNSRLMGLMLLHQKDDFMGTLSLFAEGEPALPTIAERTRKAFAYFLPRWTEVFVSLLETQRDARGMKKVKEFIAELDLLYAETVRLIRSLIRIESCTQALATGEPLHRDDLQIDERLGKWLQAAKAEVKTPYIVPTPEEPKTKKKEKATKEAKISTQEQTLHLLKAGKTIAEIATERGLKPSTITGHVAMLMEQRKVTEQEAGIDEGTMQMLSPLFATMDVEAGLRGVVDATEGVYSYDLLRLYLAAYRQRHSLQDRAQETLL